MVKTIVLIAIMVTTAGLVQMDSLEQTPDLDQPTISPMSMIEHTMLRLWQTKQASAQATVISPMTQTEHTALRVWQNKQQVAQQLSQLKISPMTQTEHTALRVWLNKQLSVQEISIH